MRRNMKEYLLIATCVVALNACNEADKIQPGTRISLSEVSSTTDQSAPKSSVQIDAQRSGGWLQHLGGATNLIGNPRFDGQPNLITTYSLDNVGQVEKIATPIFGSLNGSKVYGAAAPIIAGNQIFHYDVNGVVHAINTSGGRLWTKSLVPPGFSKGDGLGGGIAYSDGVIYATTGFGEVVALSATNGQKLWTYVQKAPIHKPPLVSNGMVIAISGGANTVALTQTTGQVVWRHFGDPNSMPTRLNAGVPAANDGKVVVSYATGAIACIDILSGQEIWKKSTISDSFSGSKSVFADITGDPVIAGDLVILGTASGILGLNFIDGSVVWNQSVGTKGPLMVSGNSIFGLTSTNQVFRLDRTNGALSYKNALPKFASTGAFNRGKFAYGDLRLAGGSLWVSNGRNGMVRIDPRTGSVTGTFDMGVNLETAPIFGDGIMVSVSEGGKLLAYR